MGQTKGDAQGGPADRTYDIRGFVSVNDALQVRRAGDPETETYHSRIQGVSQGRLSIAWPTSRGVPMVVQPGQVLDFHIVRDGALENFGGLVEEATPGPLALISVFAVSPIRKIQRRQYVRVKCLMPVEISGVAAGQIGTEASAETAIQTVSSDISAGGISFRHARRFPEGSRATLRLSLPDGRPDLVVPCMVVYSKFVSERRTLYRTALRFIGLSESERSRIIRFVYRTQLQAQRSGNRAG